MAIPGGEGRIGAWYVGGGACAALIGEGDSRAERAAGAPRLHQKGGER